MMFTHKNLMTVCCAAVLAFGLAACGSSSDDDGMPPVIANGMEPEAEDAPAGPTPEEMAAAAEAATKAVGTKAKAIGKVMVADAFDAVDVTVTAKRTGPNEIKVEGDDDFTHVMGPMYRLEHAADDDGNVVEEIVLVDHTITAPKGMGFTKVHPLTARDLDETVNADGIGVADDDFTAVGVTAETTENFGLVMSDDFVAGASATTLLTFKADDASTTTVNESSKVAGTFDGAPGTYQCTGTAATGCAVTLTRDAKGMVSITQMAITWIFIPDDGARVYVIDPVYTSYGVWLKRTTDADGVLTYNKVDTYAMGHGSGASDVNLVTGTATYEGSALGVYVHNVLDSGGEVASATGGCQRRSKSTPLAGVKMHHLMRFSPALAVVPVVHRRDPRCFV